MWWQTRNEIPNPDVHEVTDEQSVWTETSRSTPSRTRTGTRALSLPHTHSRIASTVSGSVKTLSLVGTLLNQSACCWLWYFVVVVLRGVDGGGGGGFYKNTSILFSSAHHFPNAPLLKARDGYSTPTFSILQFRLYSCFAFSLLLLTGCRVRVVQALGQETRSSQS